MSAPELTIQLPRADLSASIDDQDDDDDATDMVGYEGVLAIETAGNMTVLSSSPLDVPSTSWVMNTKTSTPSNPTDAKFSRSSSETPQKTPILLNKQLTVPMLRSFSVGDPQNVSNKPHLSLYTSSPTKTTVVLQDNKCYFCGEQSVRMRLCTYTGRWACRNCHSGEMFIIPALILDSWNLRRYPVSRPARKYLTEHYDMANIDISVHAPRLYDTVQSLTRVYSLRYRLSIMAAYVQPCPHGVSLLNLLGNKRYMIHLHLYSIADLVAVDNGELEANLVCWIQTIAAHTTSCKECIGTQCVVCHKGDNLYPYDVSHVRKCSHCDACYHVHCRGKIDKCPICNMLCTT